jgi:hypothetical protein
MTVAPPRHHVDIKVDNTVDNKCVHEGGDEECA